LKTDEFQNIATVITEAKFLCSNSYFLFVLGITGYENTLCIHEQENLPIMRKYTFSGRRTISKK